MKFGLPLLVLLCAATGACFAQQHPPFNISIVPTWTYESHTNVIPISDDRRHPFYVVITNTSKQPQLIPGVLGSRIDHYISFVAATPDGRTFQIHQPLRDGSGREPFLIEPGEHFVCPIFFDRDWDGRPTDAGNRSSMPECTIKAVYSLPPSNSVPRRMWGGHVESKLYTVSFERY
jgi:hypothetical protein